MSAASAGVELAERTRLVADAHPSHTPGKRWLFSRPAGVEWHPVLPRAEQRSTMPCLWVLVCRCHVLAHPGCCSASSGECFVPWPAVAQGADVMEKVRSSKVLVVGAGGIGEPGV